MFAKLFLSMCQSSAFRKFAWKPIYNNLARVYNIDYWHFMNYGYSFKEPDKPLELLPEDESHRYATQLYHYVAAQVVLESKKVLEVGCGRGGGASYIKRYLKPTEMVGLDLAINAVNFANKTHLVEGLSYIQGDSQSLPFEDNSFDAIVNIESCHAYPSMEIFFAEVKRVLRPGGHFLCADIRLAKDMETMEQNLKDSGMTFLEKENISPNVVQAIELNDKQLNQLIDVEIHTAFKPIFKEFAGVKNSKMHLDLISGERIYNRFHLQKK